MSAAGTMPFCSLLPYIVSTLFITLHIVNSKDLNEQIIQMSYQKCVVDCVCSAKKEKRR